MSIDVNDYYEINQLLGNYAVLIDSHQVDAWTNLFWSDGVFKTPVPPDNDILEFRGHERIREIAAWGYEGCHNGGMPAIAIDGDEAKVTWPFIIITRLPGAPFETRVGRYDLELERRDGRWGIASLLVIGGIPVN